MDPVSKLKDEEEVAKILAAGDQESDENLGPSGDTSGSTDTLSVSGTDSDDTGDGTDATPSSESKAEAKPQSALKLKLIALGYDIDEDATDDDLAEALIERSTRLDQARQEAERKATEVAERLSKQAEQKPKEETKAEDKPKRERKLKPLAKPDPELEMLVEFDADAKRYVGKDKFGSAGQEAAKQFNAYAAERAKRAEAMIEDPTSLLLDDLSDEIDRRAEEKARAVLASLRQEQEASKQQADASTRETRWVTYMDSVKDKLYKLNPDGSIKKTINGDPVFTEAGLLFAKEYNDRIADARPEVDPVDIAKKAYSSIERVITVAQTVKKDKPQETVEKKKKFLERKKHESGVSGNVNTATTQDKFNSGVRSSLLQALLEDPDNEDNAELAKLRS